MQIMVLILYNKAIVTVHVLNFIHIQFQIFKLNSFPRNSNLKFLV